MAHQFRRNVHLTKAERAEFQRLVRPLQAGPTEAKLGLRTLIRVASWRHLTLAPLLLPIGLAIMVVGVVTWWPAGLAGAPLVAIGLYAGVERLTARHLRWRLGQRSKTRSAE
jgi:hypothetical protein